MSLTCECPVPTAIGDIGDLTCPENVGQIQRLVFWRGGNSIATVAALILEATWTTLFAAADDTHAIFTPLIDNPVCEPGAVMTVGSGNEVRNGIPKIVGNEPTNFVFTMRNFTPAIIRAIKELMCEPSMEVIFVQEDSKFVHVIDGVLVKGFPVQGLRISDKKIGGLNALDEHTLEFKCPENWSDYLTITDPTANFDPLTDW